MRPTLGRRSLFFGFVALVCLALVPPSPPEFRWVAWFAASLAAMWAVLWGAENLMRPRAERRVEGPPEVEMPFAPPPRPGR